MPLKQMITIGLALPVAVLASLTPALIALPLWVFAVLLFWMGPPTENRGKISRASAIRQQLYPQGIR